MTPRPAFDAAPPPATLEEHDAADELEPVGRDQPTVGL
jgi:hypothetical protein